jgi:hypothetical protein
MLFKHDLALQYTPLSKQPFETQPQIENWRHHLKSSIQYAHHKNQQVQGIVTTRSGVRWLILNSTHCTRKMYHIFHAQVWYEFCISFLYSWIDVSYLMQLFNWRALQIETHTRASILSTGYVPIKPTRHSTARPLHTIFNYLIIDVRHKCAATFPTATSFLLSSLLIVYHILTNTKVVHICKLPHTTIVDI